MAIRWYEFREKGKTSGGIICKGNYEAEAKREALDRTDLDAEDLICVGHWPYWQPGIPAPPRIGGVRRRAAEDTGAYG